MKTICAPSQVMREGRDLNQHGQAGRQEQASSSSPLIFQEVLAAAAAALPGRPSEAMPHTIARETIDLPDRICFINFFLSLKHCHLIWRLYSSEASGQYRKHHWKIGGIDITTTRMIHVLATMARVLTFRASSEELHALDRRHLALGLLL